MVVAIVDYGLGNLFSILNACSKVGLEAVITSDSNLIKHSDAIILPGVGAFGEAMKSINTLNFDRLLKECVEKSTPIIGICLGMQLLFSESQEFGVYSGLNLIPGVVKKLEKPTISPETLRTPHIGWSQISLPMGDTSWDNSILDGIDNQERMYFVHSYVVHPVDSSIILSKTSYEGVVFCSAVKYKMISAVQFHPERSGPAGLIIFNNLKSMIKEGR